MTEYVPSALLIYTKESEQVLTRVQDNSFATAVTAVDYSGPQ